MNAMKSSRRITIGIRFAVGLCCLLMADAAFAQKVSVDFDKDIDFSSFKTYAFAEGTPTPETLANQRIERAIDAQLAAKGLTKVASNADLTVVYHCSVTQKTQLNTTSLGGWGWGPGWRRGWGWGGRWRGGWGGLGGNAITQVEQIPVGHSSLTSVTRLTRDTSGARLPQKLSAAVRTRIQRQSTRR